MHVWAIRLSEFQRQRPGGNGGAVPAAAAPATTMKDHITCGLSVLFFRGTADWRPPGVNELKHRQL
jgi:hypothetical protein